MVGTETWNTVERQKMKCNIYNIKNGMPLVVKTSSDKSFSLHPIAAASTTK